MKSYFIALIAGLALCSCKKLTEVDATGQVRDALTQAPLDSVYVALYEDNEGAFMGEHLLQETTTDASGSFRFNFKYKEGPYKIYATRRGYRYSRVVSDNILKQTREFTYQEIEPLKHEQYFTFDLAPQAYLNIGVKNIAPAQVTDQIRVEVGRAILPNSPFLRIFDGPVDLELPVGNVDANKYIPIKYSVRENDTWRHERDSVIIQPGKTLFYKLHY